MSYTAVVEAGGTKFICAIIDNHESDHHKKIIAKAQYPTTTPDETLSVVIEFFKTQQKNGLQFTRLGLACFGPLDLNKASNTHGYITSTPKPGWRNVAIMATLQQALNCEVYIDTDVNAAALAEYKWGNGNQLPVVVYITVGTGLGGGVVINGRPLHGLMHPEIGHMLVDRQQNQDGACPFHKNCLEGYASGTGMKHLWKQSAETLPEEHPAWDLQAKLLGICCHNLFMTLSPNKIILGGGVMQQSFLLDKVRQHTQTSLASYLVLPKTTSFNDIILGTGLGNDSGLLGAYALTLETQ